MFQSLRIEKSICVHLHAALKVLARLIAVIQKYPTLFANRSSCWSVFCHRYVTFPVSLQVCLDVAPHALNGAVVCRSSACCICLRSRRFCPPKSSSMKERISGKRSQGDFPRMTAAKHTAVMPKGGVLAIERPTIKLQNLYGAKNSARI